MIWARLVGFILAIVAVFMRASLRVSFVDDRRSQLRSDRKPYVLCLLHAHQLAAICANDEPRLVVMVSRSRDGELLIPTLSIFRISWVRGSSRKGAVDKGGRDALERLVMRSQAGDAPVLTVDGPRGPRGHVHRGAVALARRTGAWMIPTVAIAHRRVVLGRSWDRFQIPMPFTRVVVAFGTPIEPVDDDEVSRRVLASALAELEAKFDAAG